MLARSDGEVVDGHLRLKAARKLGITQVPVILCDEWTPQQVKAFRLIVNRSVTWADWDEDLLSHWSCKNSTLRISISVSPASSRARSTDFCRFPTRSEPMPRRLFPTSGVPSRRLMDMREASGAVRGRLTSEDVARLLGERKPILMVTDPPYGIELDSEWRDRAGLNDHGPAEPSYMKHRTKGHTETTISGDTRADWSETFELVHDQQIIWDKGRTRPYAHTLLVCSGTLLVCTIIPCLALSSDSASS